LRISSTFTVGSLGTDERPTGSPAGRSLNRCLYTRCYGLIAVVTETLPVAFLALILNLTRPLWTCDRLITV